MRLAKYLAHAGVASRRAAEEIVRAGRVTSPARSCSIRPATLTIERRGGRWAPARRRRATVVYAVNKPVGVLSTAKTRTAVRTVVDLVSDEKAGLYPVGRLDADTSGLILLTNDGALAHRLTHPSFEVDEDLPRARPRRPRRRAGIAPPARGCAPARRHDRPRPRPSVAVRGPGADDPRGSQPSSASGVRGGRPPV